MISLFPFLITLVALAATVSAHMQLRWPLPYRSTFNPATVENMKDYSMTEPLGNWPCKGYIDPSASPVVTWSAGQTYNYTLSGSAIHGGGSCQTSLSYDNGVTWNVIGSYMGGCVLESLTNDFTIPAEAPSGKAIFAWSWFNLVGNREMYMNCAAVEITGGGSGLDSADYPAPFVANVAVAPGCKTIEGTNVVFPNPGKNVQYGGVYASSHPTTPAGILGDCGAAASPGPGPSPSASNEAVVSSVSASAEPSASATPSASSTWNWEAPVESHKGSRCVRKRKVKVQKRHERLLTRIAHEQLA